MRAFYAPTIKQANANHFEKTDKGVLATSSRIQADNERMVPKGQPVNGKFFSGIA